MAFLNPTPKSLRNPKLTRCLQQKPRKWAKNQGTQGLPAHILELDSTRTRRSCQNYILRTRGLAGREGLPGHFVVKNHSIYMFKAKKNRVFLQQAGADDGPKPGHFSPYSKPPEFHECFLQISRDPQVHHPFQASPSAWLGLRILLPTRAPVGSGGTGWLIKMNILKLESRLQ